jgi:magnesium transporter
MHAELDHESQPLDVASAYRTRNVPVVRPEASVAEIRAVLDGGRFDTLVSVVVCDDNRFIGLIDIEELFTLELSVSARDVVDMDVPVVAPGVDQEVAAWRAAQRGKSCLVVVDHYRRFLGIIPPVSIISILLAEHDEDMSRISGLMQAITPARLSAQEPVLRRIVHRLPWLLIGLAGAFVAANIMGLFEDRLQANVMVAFFVPSVVYLAAAIGVQSSMVVVRGLSVGVRIRSILLREFGSGILISLLTALLFFGIAALWWGDIQIAFGVGVSLAAAGAMATLIAVMLPWVLQNLGIDPAYGSGPVGTILQDLSSILLYFAIITRVLSG